MFTVNQVAERLLISEHTIRYYDRQGLMPFLKKDSGGKRSFTEEDICFIELIICLKTSHMSLTDIRQYIEYQFSDADTTHNRKQILENHRKFILGQIENMKQSLCSIDYKLEHCVGNNECKET
jgi:DNA-binding transcriptional MerR regulator